MKSLAASNRHLTTVLDRQHGVERNVRSSSAMEGISLATFRSAVLGRSIAKDASSKTPRVSGRAKKD